MSTHDTPATAGNDSGHDRDWVWHAHSSSAAARAARAIDSWEREAQAGPRVYSAMRGTGRRTQGLTEHTRRTLRRVEAYQRANTRRWDHHLPDGGDVIVTAQYVAPRDVTLFRWSVQPGTGAPQLWTPSAHRRPSGPIPVPPYWHPYAVAGRALDTEPDWAEIDAAFPALTPAVATA